MEIEYAIKYRKGSKKVNLRREIKTLKEAQRYVLEVY